MHEIILLNTLFFLILNSQNEKEILFTNIYQKERLVFLVKKVYSSNLTKMWANN